MRKSAVLVALAAVAVFAGCHHRAPAAPPNTTAPVAPPPAPEPVVPPELRAQEDEYARIRSLTVEDIDRMGLLAEIHFDFDRADLRDGDRRILEKNAEVLKKFDFLLIAIGGHCDERGTVEYNLALGERRARVALDTLVSLGVPGGRLKTVSYGKESPLCKDSTEECWARNRRDHFSVTGKAGGH
ncbi:MAG TPA: OmpA family protein [Vicinamibacteria bacterium]|jgi:peptidoglycan-associated lipoprotein|nr:OmpA family protein [Vicinamibacteria bacterium]